jgi:hypothetical protein
MTTISCGGPAAASRSAASDVFDNRPVRRGVDRDGLLHQPVKVSGVRVSWKMVPATGQPSSREPLFLRSGVRRGFSVDELDAAGRKARVAAAGVQDIHLPVLIRSAGGTTAGRVETVRPNRAGRR